MELEDVEIDAAVRIAIELLLGPDGTEGFEEGSVWEMVRAWYPSLGRFGDPRLQRSIDRVVAQMIAESVLAS